MAKFRFRLQSYLGVKEKLEDQKKQEYGKALQKVDEEEMKKKKLEAELSDCILSLRQEIEKGIHPQEMVSRKRYISFVEKQIIKQEAEIKKARAFAESKRIELLAAVKQRKMVATLKEKKYEEYLEEELKTEQKIVDEIVSYKYSKKVD